MCKFCKNTGICNGDSGSHYFCNCRAGQKEAAKYGLAKKTVIVEIDITKKKER